MRLSADSRLYFVMEVRPTLCSVLVQSAVCARRLVASSPFALSPALSRESVNEHQGKSQRNEQRRENKNMTRPLRYSSSADAMKEGVGGNYAFGDVTVHTHLARNPHIT